MSLLYALKPQKDRLLTPLSSMLCAVGLTPNMVTAAGLLLSIGAGLLAASGMLCEAIMLFLFSAFLDAVDGSLARSCGMSTGFGKYFDSFADRASELIFVAGAVYGGAPASALIVVAGSGALLLVRIFNHSRGLDSNAAMFGRPERLSLLLLGLFVPEPYGTAFFTIACFLCIVSSLQALASGMEKKENITEAG